MDDPELPHEPASPWHTGLPELIQLSSAEPLPGVRALWVTGELDLLTAPMLAKEVGIQLAARPRRLIIDLTAVSFLGSSGLAVLIQTQQTAARDDISLSIVADSHPVLSPLQLVGVSRTLEVFDDFSDALRSQQ